MADEPRGCLFLCNDREDDAYATRRRQRIHAEKFFCKFGTAFSGEGPARVLCNFHKNTMEKYTCELYTNKIREKTTKLSTKKKVEISGILSYALSYPHYPQKNGAEYRMERKQMFCKVFIK